MHLAIVAAGNINSSFITLHLTNAIKRFNGLAFCHKPLKQLNLMRHDFSVLSLTQKLGKDEKHTSAMPSPMSAKLKFKFFAKADEDE